MNHKLRNELIVLFGRGRVEMAEAVDVVELDLTAPRMEAVQAACDELLKHTGQPRRQREIVDSLTDGTALVLCMWLMDTDFAGRVTMAA
jgi:hypothetical protein